MLEILNNSREKKLCLKKVPVKDQGMEQNTLFTDLRRKPLGTSLTGPHSQSQ